MYESLLTLVRDPTIPSMGVKCTADAIREAASSSAICPSSGVINSPAFSAAIPVLSQCLVRCVKYGPSSPDSAAAAACGGGQLSSDACVSVGQALVSLASKNDLRPLFQIQPPPRDEEAEKSCSSSPVMRLLSIVRSPKCIAKEKQWALAACTNALLNEPSVTLHVHENGGTVLVFAILTSPKGEEAKCIGHEVRKYAACLLSRLICHETVLSELSHPSSFRILIQVLEKSTLKLESIGEKPVDGDIEEHIVRVLARALREAKNMDELLDAALEENLVMHLVSLLPTPRCDELTRSVVVF